MIRSFPSNVPYDGSADDAPVSKLWYGMLADSLRRGAKQIHLFLSDLPEPSPLIRPGVEEVDELLADAPLPEPERMAVVRAYVNDGWEDIISLPGKMYGALLQRLKVMSSFSLARRPPLEQGRFQLKVSDAVYEIAVTVRVRPDGGQEAMIDLPSASVQNVGQST